MIRVRRNLPYAILSLLAVLLAAVQANARDNAAQAAPQDNAVSAGEAPPGPRAVIRIAAAGDIMMGTTFPEEILPPEDGATLFRAVGPLLAGHDLVFGNLEGPLTDAQISPKCPMPVRKKPPCFAFRMPPRYVERLRAAGFTAVNVANNHSLDFGMDGMDDTLATLDNAGIQAVGGERVAVFPAAGKRMAVAGFSYSLPTRYVHPLSDIDRAREVVAELKAEYDLVVVSFHGGAEGKGALRVADAEEEFLGERRGNVVRFARAAVDAGADLVLGHGPHVPRALEIYRGKLIAYSLGNFVAYSFFNLKEESGIGYVLQAELSPATGEVIRFRTPSVVLRGLGIPHPDPSGRAEIVLRKLSEEFLAGEPDADARRAALAAAWEPAR
jgi:poly-gamma-glutamate capsule biosynthesis protein CapA/YwtB (metallophosphatase superfamily)